MNGQTSQFISFYEVSEKVIRAHIFAGIVVTPSSLAVVELENEGFLASPRSLSPLLGDSIEGQPVFLQNRREWPPYP